MLTILFLRCVLRSSIVWSLYAQSVEAFLGLSIVEFAWMLLYQFMKLDKSWACRLKKVSYGLIIGSLSFVLVSIPDAKNDWYFSLVGGISILLHFAFVLYAVSGFLKIVNSARRGLGAHVAIYRIRKALYNSYVAASFSMTLYYIGKVISLMDSSGTNISISSTTQYNNSTVSRCADHDKKDEILQSLYDTTEFTLSCTYDIWRRNRINMLAWLQVKILFGLTWRLSHVKTRLKNHNVPLHVMHAQELSILIVTVSQVIKYVVLFLGITLWLDDIRDWYVMPLGSSVLLTIYIFIEDMYEKSFVSRRLHWI